ncbi:RNA polymerase sigma factor [Spirosoma arcticum]
MTNSDFPHSESFPPTDSVAIDQITFFQLYDQYAPVLLGVITAIVNDKDEAVRVLEVTFTKIRSQFGQFKSHQPLFVWLLSIARATASDANKNLVKPDLPVLHRSSTGKVDAFVNSSTTTVIPGAQIPVLSPTYDLLNTIIYKNCTLEEAVSNMGTPVETARQQLRLAMQQLRSSKSV